MSDRVRGGSGEARGQAPAPPQAPEVEAESARGNADGALLPPQRVAKGFHLGPRQRAHVKARRRAAIARLRCPILLLVPMLLPAPLIAAMTRVLHTAAEVEGTTSPAHHCETSLAPSCRRGEEPPRVCERGLGHQRLASASRLAIHGELTRNLQHHVQVAIGPIAPDLCNPGIRVSPRAGYCSASHPVGAIPGLRGAEPASVAMRARGQHR